tara:strand:- start:136 stop:582 length:447 start_codon:yes stop_codon:yes gene_type:complete
MILKFFTDKSQNSDVKEEDNEDIINVIALLIEASSIDDNIEKIEIDKIIEIICKNFDLNEETAKNYYNKAIIVKENNTSFHNFTSKIHKKYNYSEKLEILEMLWEVILANKIVDDFESNFMRRISGLLHIKDVDSGLVKNKIKKKLEK